MEIKKENQMDYVRGYVKENKDELLNILSHKDCGGVFYSLAKFTDESIDKFYAIRAFIKDSKYYNDLTKTHDESAANTAIEEDLLKLFVTSIDTYSNVAIPNILIEKFLENCKNFDLNNSINSTDQLLMIIEDDGAFNFLDEGIDPANKAFSVYVTESALNAKCIKSTSPDLFEETDEEGSTKIKIRDLDILIDDPKQFKVYLHKDINLSDIVNKAIDNRKALWYKSE